MNQIVTAFQLFDTCQLQRILLVNNERNNFICVLVQSKSYHKTSGSFGTTEETPVTTSKGRPLFDCTVCSALQSKLTLYALMKFKVVIKLLLITANDDLRCHG